MDIQKKILIEDLESFNRFKKFVNEFENELYLPSFPNENEREPLEIIEERIIDSNSYPRTILQLLLKGERVIAGCVSDCYEDCDSIEPIYLVVRPEYRNLGYGRLLLDDLRTLRPGLIHMFVEVDNPKCVNANFSAIDPSLRIEIYKHLGFLRVPINYVQPPLFDGADFERNLILFYRGAKLTVEALKKFLKCFYLSLDCVDSIELKRMFEELENGALENI